ncbi:MAG: hypothetical protein ACFFG0_03015 [Candidatus Thorarchaeota archaeon]
MIPNTHIEVTSRMYSLDGIKEFYIGESIELKRRWGVGFFNTIYVSKNGTVTFYYDKKEIEEFENALEKYLDEETFNDECDRFMELIYKPNIKLRKLVPSLTIFNEIDQYPEWLEEDYRNDCLRRLKRIRENTESKFYELMKKGGQKNYVYYKGKLK